ncbi:hypothetical protein R3W88_008188 [Solanum pinnatisectum]|uniref:Uncharacterized protein n=1 Tax=Solanum pinnatisectum TaxID=50273 RepID=A0AAV9M7T6_9SOLN|nr:hypothetical protein R3W88_008188 [Solanum pinnatisectum]
MIFRYVPYHVHSYVNNIRQALREKIYIFNYFFVQVYQSVRMPQLHTSLHFHLTPITMINDSSRRDLLLNSQNNLCRSILARSENPSLSRLCYRKIWGSWNRRTLFLGYLLRTWLPNVYRGYDNWYTRGASFLVLSYNRKVLSTL